MSSGVWLRADRDEKRLGARNLGVAVELHLLDVPADELVRRLDARRESGSPGTAPVTRDLLEEYAKVFQAPQCDELDLFDAKTSGGQ